MKLCLTLVLLLAAITVGAATYYVATNGNNAADGSLATPWSNIWYAANTVAAGDTVVLKAGEYNEFVTNTVSGSAGSPITFTGERGAGGQWLSIIDPSTNLSTGWVAAPEIGTGVWKKVSMPFAVRELTIGHKRVGFPYKAGDMQTMIDACYTGSGLTNGLDFLTLDSAATLVIGATTVTFWEAIQAMYSSTGTVCYLRLRDGSDPNGLNIRGSPNADGTVSATVICPTINIHSNSYITWSNVLIRGGFSGFYLTDALAHHICISSNYIANGLSAIVINNGASNNVVSGNSITTDYYGYTNIGAWEKDGALTAPYDSRMHLYNFSKYIMGGNAIASFDDRIDINSAGWTNVINGNHVYQSLGSGITLGGNVLSPTYGTIISSNRVDGNPSTGMLLSEGATETRIWDNLFLDNNLHARLHHWDTGNETNRFIYMFRNRCWLIDGIGEAFYFHFSNDDGMTYWPTFWCYHNSFSGGRGVITSSTYAWDQLGLKNCRWLNNICSDAKYFYTDWSQWTNADWVGTFDWNLITPPLPDYYGDFPPWFGTNNIKSTTNQWVSSSTMSFALPVGSQAINAALDVSQSFAVGGTNYSALPSDGTSKIGSAWDMGALEAGVVASATTLRVGTLRGP